MCNPLVLIIEDHTFLADIYKDALERVNFETRNIRDGRQALKALGETVPDLIILDMNLPGVNGNEIYRHIRSDARFQAVPVIVSTANSEMASAVSTELADTDFIFIKPVSMFQLQNIVQRLVNTED